MVLLSSTKGEIRIPPSPLVGEERGREERRDRGRGTNPPTDRPGLPRGFSDVHAILVEVVSEKTGYPAEVLEPAMQLDADLGIDWIKRVEILAALQERLPKAPVIGPEHLGTIRTLGQIAEFLGGPPLPPLSSDRPRSPASSTRGCACDLGGGGLGEDRLPRRGPRAGMQLDADLGIDSIKRVEILGPEHLGTIRTLGQIAEFLGGPSAAPAQSAPAPQAPGRSNPGPPSRSGD